MCSRSRFSEKFDLFVNVPTRKKLRKQTPSTLTLINTFVVVVVAVAVLLVLELVLHAVPALASVRAYLEYQTT